MRRRKICLSVLFVIGLLLAEIIGISGSRFGHGFPPVSEPQDFLFWGFGSTDILLATWLGMRSKSWKEIATWLETFAYLMAFTYGRMIFFSQDWTKDAFHITLPAGTYQSFAGAFIEIPVLLCQILILWALSRLFGLAIFERDQSHGSPQLSIIEIGAWCTLVALTVVWIQFLNAPNAIKTGFSYRTDLENIAKIMMVSVQNVFTISILLAMMWTWSRLWAYAFLALVGGWLLECLCIGYTQQFLSWIFAVPKSGILGRDSIERWYFLAGQLILAFVFSGITNKLGFRLVRHRHTASHITSTKCVEFQADIGQS